MPAERRPLRALTLWQPWAWCIAPGPRVAPKRCENRSWTPSPEVLARGDFLAIHAAARCDPAEEAAVARHLRQELGVFVPEKLPRGAITAVAVFDGCALLPRWIEGRRDPWFSLREDSVGWYLQDEVVALPEPVPCRGAQGLWVVPPEALERVREGWRAAKGGQGT